MAKNEKEQAEEKVSKTDKIETLQSENEFLRAELARLQPAGSRQFSAEELEPIEMIWPHKLMKPGESEEVFGLKGVANQDGLLIVTVPRYRVKNEMTRKRKLIPLSVWKKQREAELEAELDFDLE